MSRLFVCAKSPYRTESKIRYKRLTLGQKRVPLHRRSEFQQPAAYYISTHTLLVCRRLFEGCSRPVLCPLCYGHIYIYIVYIIDIYIYTGIHKYLQPRLRLHKILDPNAIAFGYVFHHIRNSRLGWRQVESTHRTLANHVNQCVCVCCLCNTVLTWIESGVTDRDHCRLTVH